MSTEETEPPPRPINNQQQFAGSYQAPVYQQQGYYQQPVQQPMQPQPVKRKDFNLFPIASSPAKYHILLPIEIPMSTGSVKEE